MPVPVAVVRKCALQEILHDHFLALERDALEAGLPEQVRQAHEVLVGERVPVPGEHVRHRLDREVLERHRDEVTDQEVILLHLVAQPENRLD